LIYLEEEQEDKKYKAPKQKGYAKKMRIKEKFIGIVLIIIGALPFLLKTKSISDFFTQNKVLSFIIPGELVYQIIIIALGALLIWTVKPKFKSY